MPAILTPDLWTDAEPWSDARIASLADDGRDALLDAARPLRLKDAVKERRLAPEQGRRIVHRLIADARDLVRSTTEALVAGGLRLGAWFTSMRDTLLPRHFAAGMAVLNNPEPPPADLGVIADESRRQLGYLWRFRGELATAEQLLSGAVARAELYAHAIWSVGQSVGQERAKRDGYTEALSVLGAADHCIQCLDEAAAGWQPIDSVVLPGYRICRSRCACWLDYQ